MCTSSKFIRSMQNTNNCKRSSICVLFVFQPDHRSECLDSFASVTGEPELGVIGLQFGEESAECTTTAIVTEEKL